MPYQSAYQPFFPCPAAPWPKLRRCQWQLYTVRALSANTSTRLSTDRKTDSSPCRCGRRNNRKQAISRNLPPSSCAAYSAHKHSAIHTTASPHPKVAMASLSVPARHTRCPHSYSPAFLPDVTDVPHSSAGRQQGTATQTIVQGKVIYS